MVEQTERVTETTRQPVTQTEDTKLTGALLAARIIHYVTSALLLLLTMRFVLVLLAANPNNAFVNFIYTLSKPFVAPFFGIFGYDLSYQKSTLEVYTLVALAVYAIIGYGLARLVAIRHSRVKV